MVFISSSMVPPFIKLSLSYSSHGEDKFVFIIREIDRFFFGDLSFFNQFYQRLSERLHTKYRTLLDKFGYLDDIALPDKTADGGVRSMTS